MLIREERVRMRREIEEDISVVRYHIKPEHVLEMLDTMDELEVAKIISCAVLDQSGLIYSLPPPRRHGDILNTHGGLAGCVQGFLASDGTFKTREEALEIAKTGKQIIRRCGGDETQLFSENLW